MFIFIIVFIIISFAVSARMKKKFRKYSQIPLKSGLSGAEIAQLMLRDNGILDVRVTCIPGQLTDHYNPAQKTVNLSEEVYYSRSTASAAVAAHECGHAVQHAMGYSALELRNAMVPVQNMSGRILNIVVMITLFGSFFLYSAFPYQTALLIIIACYLVLTLFSFITLPVEFNASQRALNWIDERKIVNSSEHAMAKDALKWAAMTYVVAALGSLVSLAYYIMIFMGGSRD